MALSDPVAAVRPVAIGDPVVIIDEQYVSHAALVTTVHGSFDTHVPCINVVYVSGDEAETDNYGRQIRRLSSLQHFGAGPNQMDHPGRYWLNVA